MKHHIVEKPGVAKPGSIEGTTVSDIPLDTGCSRTLVFKDTSVKGLYSRGEATGSYFESSSLARVSCFLMLLWVIKATVGLFGKSLESSRDFLMRCQCLTSNLLRWCVGKCSEYVVVKVSYEIDH